MTERTTIIGIDCATEPKNVGLARGTFDGARLVVDLVQLGNEVESIPSTVASWISGPTLIALDAPLGWPMPMGEVLPKHQAGQHVERDGNEMFPRFTDKIVHERARKKPLEVGANWIARTTLAALRLVQDVREISGLPIPLSWRPGDREVGIIEVYPAATLLARELAATGYKKSDDECRRRREKLLEAIKAEVDLEVDEACIVATDHALDAVLCLVAGADFISGDCVQPPACEKHRVQREGWIWFKPPALRNKSP